MDIARYTGNSQVDSFEVTLKGGCEPRVCKVKRLTEKVTCQVRDLSVATNYVIKSVACLPGGLGCSSPFTLKMWTLPSREC